MITAICDEGLISCRFKEGGYDNFSFKNFIEKTIISARQKYAIQNKRIVIYSDNCSAHLKNYVKNGLRLE